MFVDWAFLYDLVNKANLVNNLFLAYLFLVTLSVSTCFGWLCAHHQEKHLCLCDTLYLLFCVDDCLVCRICRVHTLHILHTRQSSTQNNKYQVSHKHSCFSWWWAQSRPKYVEIDKYAKNKYTRVGTLIVATIYLQLIQNRYMFRSLTVLQCSHQHCVKPVASDVEVVGYL